MAPNVLDPLIRERLTQMGCEPSADKVHDYLVARSKTDQTESELDVLKSEWGTACVPNTDTDRTYAFYAECKRLEDALHHNQIVEAVAYDALFSNS